MASLGSQRTVTAIKVIIRGGPCQWPLWALFKAVIDDALEIPKDKVGIVSTYKSTPLPSGEIAGEKVAGPSLFQKAHVLVEAGGNKALQEQVMMAGNKADVRSVSHCPAV